MGSRGSRRIWTILPQWAAEFRDMACKIFPWLSVGTIDKTRVSQWVYALMMTVSSRTPNTWPSSISLPRRMSTGKLLMTRPRNVRLPSCGFTSPVDNDDNAPTCTHQHRQLTAGRNDKHSTHSDSVLMEAIQQTAFLVCNIFRWIARTPIDSWVYLTS